MVALLFLNDFSFHEFSQISRISLCGSLCYSFGYFVVERICKISEW